MRGAILHVLGDLLGSVGGDRRRAGHPGDRLDADRPDPVGAGRAADPVHGLVADARGRACAARRRARRASTATASRATSTRMSPACARSTTCMSGRSTARSNMATLHACLDRGHRRRMARSRAIKARLARKPRHRPRHGRAGIRRLRRRARTTHRHHQHHQGDMHGRQAEGKIAVVTAAGQGIGRAIAEAFVAEGATVYASDVDARQARRAGAGQEGEARRAVDHGRRGLCGEGRAGRHPRQRRRLRASRHGARHQREGLGFFLRPQREVDAPHDPAPSCPACWSGPRKAARPARSSTSRRARRRCAASPTATPTAPARPPSSASPSRSPPISSAQGIRCNAIAPGTVRSPSWEDRVETLGKAMGQQGQGAGNVRAAPADGPRRRRRRDRADRVYLAADEAAFTTGTVMSVDGGFSL